jgi:hypothetical protein
VYDCVAVCNTLGETVRVSEVTEVSFVGQALDSRTVAALAEQASNLVASGAQCMHYS